ncbi:UPAR/Ly6 domain-containing protein crok-like [Diabrotica undecimpunctata]|uniref:UPAR/Ly6 domain-containing protein crok-like n=1 Tax=Diabrotica undecimpunctata TaxID=50387 RepID=UPI003B636702
MGKIVLFLCLFFTFFVKDGTSIKCYDCRSDVDSRCGDDFNNEIPALVNCNFRYNEIGAVMLQNISTCVKIIQTINGKKIIIRTCKDSAMSIDHINSDGNQTTCVDKDKYNALAMYQCRGPDCQQPILCDNCNAKYCPCSGKDGCNSASNLNISMHTAIFLTMLTQFFKI